jgi:hypothetical protein
MIPTRDIVAQGSTAYATAKDFCRIFKENTDQLYLLSLLLTADDHKAEGCFLASLEECTQKSSVFKEWAPRWSRRTIIKNALSVAPLVSHPESSTFASWNSLLQGQLAHIAQLPRFDRFVYVMTFLEGYSVAETSILLNCKRKDVGEARIRALSHVAVNNDWISTVQPENDARTSALANARHM